MWDPIKRMVVISRNVDFAGTSVPHSVIETREDLGGLRNAFEDEGGVNTSIQVGFERSTETVECYASEEESDDDVLTEKAISDEEAPNGIDPGVPPIQREPDAPARRIRRTEVE